MYSYGNASTHVGGRDGVPLPKVAAAPTGFVGWTICHCGLKHRPGVYHLCIDLEAPEPVMPKPKKKPTPQKPAAKREPRKAAPKKNGGGVPNRGKVVARIEEVIRRYEDGETSTDIAADIGVTRKAIIHALNTRGIPIRPATYNQKGQARLNMRVLSSEQVAEMATRYQAGESATRLGKEFGVSLSTAITSLRREGVAIRGAGSARAFSPADDVEVGRLYSAGASLADLAAKYGVGTGPVTRAVKRAGVTLRRPGTRRRTREAA